MLIQLQTGDLRATALRAPVALDVMELKGRDVRPNALEERRKWIGELLSRRRRRAHLRQACSMGLEGIEQARGDTAFYVQGVLNGADRARLVLAVQCDVEGNLAMLAREFLGHVGVKIQRHATFTIGYRRVQLHKISFNNLVSVELEISTAGLRQILQSGVKAAALHARTAIEHSVKNRRGQNFVKPHVNAGKEVVDRASRRRICRIR